MHEAETWKISIIKFLTYIGLRKTWIEEYDWFWKTIIHTEFIKLLNRIITWILKNQYKNKNIGNKLRRTVKRRDNFSSGIDTMFCGNCIRSISVPKSDVSESNGLSLLSNGLIDFFPEWGSSSDWKRNHKQ